MRLDDAHQVARHAEKACQRHDIKHGRVERDQDPSGSKEGGDHREVQLRRRVEDHHIISVQNRLKRFTDPTVERGCTVSEAQSDLKLVLHDVHGGRDQIHCREVRFANDI